MRPLSKRSRKGWSALVLGAALVAGCTAQSSTSSSPAAPKQVRITITGSSTVAPLMSEIAKQFEKSHPGIRIDVQSGGSSRGIADVRQGLAQIGMISRAMKDSEKDLTSALIARDGLSMVVNKENPVQQLTRDQVIGIYTGKLTNWKSLGGLDAPITVISKAEGRSTLEVFTEYFGLANRDIRAQVVIGDNQQEIQTVSGDPRAIGYVSIGSAEYEATHGAPIKLLALDNLEPSTANVANGSYPITRELNLVAREPVSAEVRELMSYAQSPEVKKLVSAQFFIPVNR